MLQTSLDKTINVSPLGFPETTLALSGLSSSITSAVVVDCSNILSGCSVTGGGERVTVTRGSEHLTGISVVCFLRTFSCPLSTEPTPTVIRDARQRYNRVFPRRADFEDIPFHFSMSAFTTWSPIRGGSGLLPGGTTIPSLMSWYRFHELSPGQQSSSTTKCATRTAFRFGSSGIRNHWPRRSSYG
ncbi:hypothetical protein BDM02DRAFT_3036665 [Thelephora ganbajun]|uniref:Uncharacterized protein n=1 Tax=Thelephora ganbajun TaxID=370292 RepID=A0ACB6Z9L8_THEGA|nr:hypothetical protein BDM02DRAFT_3036665 [Thelephora ganbajun]